MVGEYTATTHHDFFLLPIASGVSCSCVDALHTCSSKLPPSPAVFRCLPLSPAVYNPSKFAPQPKPKGADEGQEFTFSDQELHYMIINFVLAGRDTTANLLTWTIYQV